AIFKSDLKCSAKNSAVAPVVTEVTQVSSTPSHSESYHSSRTFDALAKSDTQLAALSGHYYSKTVSAEPVNTTKTALEANSFKVHLVNSRGEAFETLKSLIPSGASINNAYSTTLEEIGEWDSLHTQILVENDFAKQWELRRTIRSTVDHFLTSMSAITEDGKLAHADLAGSKVGSIAFGAKNVIVAGNNKIVKDEGEAQQCTDGFALAVEGAHACDVYGVAASDIAHNEMIYKANPYFPGRIPVVHINDSFGF
ncbi:hypothetical protein BGX27_003754, partial [Mortierella sp. AM989]